MNLPDPPASKFLDSVDHVAIEVDDLEATVRWYLERFSAISLHRDETWALLEFANVRLAFVTRGQHPPHFGIVREDAEKFGTLRTHRDGKRYVYLEDPSGNSVEILSADTATTGPETA